MNTFLRNLAFLFRYNLRSNLELFRMHNDTVANILEEQWQQIRILNGMERGEFMKRRPGGDSVRGAGTKLQPLPLKIAAEVEATMRPLFADTVITPLAKPRRTRAKKRKTRKR